MLGLLTPYNVNNYGTKLQAYAVQTIFSQYDDVEIIRYEPGFIDKVIARIENIIYKCSTFNDVIPNNTGKRLEESLAKRRRLAIKSFDSNYKFSPIIRNRRELASYSKKYTAVVCGSDQIWNPRLLGMRVYMLEFVPQNVRRIACAPSFGVEFLPDQLKSAYKKRIKNIEFLSVREESGCRIARELGRTDVFLSLDPTLIAESDIWKVLSNSGRYNYEYPYIFCYFLGTRDIGREIASYIKKVTGYKIINLAHFKTYVECDEFFADVDLYDVNPADFISLIANADFVVTDSFHGTVFSTIFKTNFYSVERHEASFENNTNNRIYSFLMSIGLQDRLIRDINLFDSRLKDVSWETAYKKLELRQVECRKFVNNAMKGEKYGDTIKKG